MSFYETKVLPYLESTSRVNLLTKVPFIGTAFELKELGRQLQPGEDIWGLTECKFNGIEQCLATVTNKRLILIRKGLVIDRSVISIPAQTLVSTGVSRKLLKGEVYLSFKDGRSCSLTDLWWTDTEEFQTQLNRMLSAAGGGGYYGF